MLIVSEYVSKNLTQCFDRIKGGYFMCGNRVTGRNVHVEDYGPKINDRSVTVGSNNNSGNTTIININSGNGSGNVANNSRGNFKFLEIALALLTGGASALFDSQFSGCGSEFVDNNALDCLC